MSAAAVRERSLRRAARTRGKISAQYLLNQPRNRLLFIDRLLAHRGAMHFGDSDARKQQPSE
jgi:hypothetical protein